MRNCLTSSFARTCVVPLLPIVFGFVFSPCYAGEPLAFDRFSEKEFSVEKFAAGAPVGLSAGYVSIGHAPVQSGLSDGQGLLISLNPGEGMLIIGNTPYAVGSDPVLAQCLVWVSGPGASVALGALNIGEQDVADGRMAYVARNAVGAPSEDAEQLAFVYRAPSGVIVPVFQAALPESAPGPVEILFDNFEIFLARFPKPDNLISLLPCGDFESNTESLISGIGGVPGQTRVVSVESGHAVELTTTPEGGSANAGAVAEQPTTEQAGWLFTQTTVLSAESGTNLVTLVLTSEREMLGVTEFASDAVGNELLHTGGFFKYAPQFLMVALQHTPGAPGVSERAVLDDLLVFRHTGDLDPETHVTGEIAATMVAPLKIYAGGKASVNVTTFSGQDLKPTPAAIRLTMSTGEVAIPIFTGSTDATGHRNILFKAPNVPSGSYSFALNIEGNETLSANVTVQEGPVLFVETDKPIYRPGQTIQGRVLSLSNDLTPLPGTVEVSISDAKGIKIHKETVTADLFGITPFNLPLANELNLGTWKIRAKSGSSETVLDVLVDRYVLPKFAVEVNTEKTWFLYDEQINGTIDAQYFFGKPVEGKVNLAAFRYIGAWDQYATFTGELQNGKIEFFLPPVEYVSGTLAEEGAGTLQLDVVVTDESGHEERTSLLLRVVDAPIQVRLITDSQTLKPGLPLQVLVITETPDGVPTSGEVSLQTTCWNENMEVIEQSTLPVSTANGLRLVDIPAVPEKAVMGQFHAELKAGNYLASQTITLNSTYSPSSSFLHVRQTETGICKIGDQAAFTAFSTNPGTIFYDVFAAGRTVFSGVVTGRDIRFTITPEMSPESKIVAYLINPDGEVSADVLPFEVEQATTDSLKASFSADEVLPGNPVALHLQTPGEAMIGLSIVDESVYALAAGRLNLQQVFAELERIFMEPQVEEHPGSPWDMPRVGSEGSADTLKGAGLQMVTSKGFFLPQGKEIEPWRFWRGPGVFFGNEKNFPEPVGEPENGAGGGDLAEVQRVRQFFPETWLWNPQIKTDASGAVSIDLTAPDSITTWRLHAVSTSERGLGITEGSLRVFQDFFVEPDLPYAVTRGEEFPLLLQVFNYVDVPQQVRLELKAGDFFEPLGDLVQTVTVEPNAVVGVSIPIKPVKVGTWTLEVIAQSASRADAIRKEFRVEPEGTRRESVTNGIIHEGETVTLDACFPWEIRPEPETDTAIPAIVPDSGKLRLAITPSLVAQSMNGIDDLLGMPYGCGEQNMIFLAPDIEVLRYLELTGQLNPEIRAKAETFVNVGYQRELTYRHSDGSFSAFGESDEEGSLWLTAFVLSTFSVARDVRTIDETVLASAATWIESHQLADGSWEPVGFICHQEMIGGLNGNYGLTAYVLNALSTYAGGSATVRQNAANYLQSHLMEATDNPYALAIAAFALSGVDHPAAGQAVDLLLTLAETDKNGMYWSPNSVETTAYAALALMEQSRPEAAAALSWIAAQRNSLGGFGSTQDTVMAFRALAEAALRQSRNTNADIDLLLDGELLHTFHVNSANFDVLQVYEIPREGALELRHRGQGDITYQLAKIFNVWSSGDAGLIRNGMDLQVAYSTDHVAVDDLVDVRVTATYYGLEEPGESGGNEKPEALGGEPIPDPEGTPVPTPQPSSGMLILDISVPTGFAAVQESLDKVLELDLIKRVEQAGRKVIFYVDGLEPAESVEFTFQVKALFPVRAIIGTSAAYSYYNTGIRAESPGSQIVAE
ncbi:MAG TPA: alpha-2-macroglobulin family protein [bacterium]|nr:alpha-2-macroglobulin family protein [bacterium]HQL63245.1 alpha-2-macroglobulin family protein [bacterium]